MPEWEDFIGYEGEPRLFKRGGRWGQVRDVSCEKETDMAILCSFYREDDRWVPKSQIWDRSEVCSRGDSGILVVTRWLLQQWDAEDSQKAAHLNERLATARMTRMTHTNRAPSLFERLKNAASSKPVKPDK